MLNVRTDSAPVLEANPDFGVQTYRKVLIEIGYKECDSGEFENQNLKIALYTVNNEVRHLARQLDNGLWTSKLGNLQDIEHSLESLEGGDGSYEYGQVTHFFKRLVQE